MNWAIDYIVEPDYLKAMGIPLQRGRFFSSQDNGHSPLVVVIDDVFAQKYFPHENPVGKRINVKNFAGSSGSWAWADTSAVGFDGRCTNPRAQLYLPCMQCRMISLP